MTVKITQRAGRNSILIVDGEVTINGVKSTPEEAKRIEDELQEKLREAFDAFKGAKPSPEKGDTVIVIDSGKTTRK